MDYNALVCSEAGMNSVESSENRCTDCCLGFHKALLGEGSRLALSSVTDKNKGGHILLICVSTLNARPSHYNWPDAGMPLLSPSGSDARFCRSNVKSLYKFR